MATSSIVNTLGAGSGIDVKALAQSLVDAEKMPKQERIEAKIAKSEAKITGYGAVKFALSELKNAFGKLNDASDFSAIVPANNQPSAFGITAAPSAQAGSFSIEVLHTAMAQRTASNVFEQRSTELNGGQAFTLQLSIGGGTPQTIQVNPKTTPAPGVDRPPTPADVVSAINGAKLGVSAQLINTGSGHQIVLSGQTGLANGFTLTTTASDVGFVGQLEAARDASVKVNGLTVTRSSNTINEVIDGVTLELFASTTGAARLDLNRNTTDIKDNIRGLVTAYNDFEETLKILGDRSSEVEDFGGVLAGESLLQSVRTQVRAMITEPSSTPGTTIKAARDVGLSIDRFGKLMLDETRLDNALQNNFNEVSTMFSAGTNNQSVFSQAAAGLAGTAFNSIDKMLRSTGLIDTQSRSATTEIAKFKAEMTVLEERMEKLMTRYMNQFSVMESIVGNSNSMRESLKGTFEGMMRSYGN